MKTIEKTVSTTTTTTVHGDVPPPAAQEEADGDFVAALRRIKVRENVIQKLLESGIESAELLSGLGVEDLVELGITKVLARSLINQAKEGFPVISPQGEHGIRVSVKPGGSLKRNIIAQHNTGSINNRE